MKFDTNDADLKAIFIKEQSARYIYSQKIRDKGNVRKDFYKKKRRNLKQINSLN